MKKMTAAIALMVAALGHAQAQNAPANPLRFVAGMGITAGGDKLVNVSYSNGESYDLHAGGLIVFDAGVDYRFSPEFSMQSTVSYHVDQANAKNGNVKFKRFPIELIGYYHPNTQWRVGGGVRYISSAKLSGSGFGSVANDNFDSTVGALVEAEYMVSPVLGFKVRLVSEKYKYEHSSTKINGNHIGFFGNYYF